VITTPTIISSDDFTYRTDAALESSTLLMLGSAVAGMVGENFLVFRFVPLLRRWIDLGSSRAFLTDHC